MLGEMTPEQFIAWRGRMATLRGGKYTQADAARDLGKKVLQIKRYERLPAEPDDAPPHPIPRDTALACAALEAGLSAE